MVVDRDFGLDNVELNFSIQESDVVLALIYIRLFLLHFQMVNYRKPTRQKEVSDSRYLINKPYRRGVHRVSKQ